MHTWIIMIVNINLGYFDHAVLPVPVLFVGVIGSRYD